MCLLSGTVMWPIGLLILHFFCHIILFLWPLMENYCNKLIQCIHVYSKCIFINFRVEEIHLSLNEHDDISLPEPFKTYPTVKKIHMSKNNIKNWSELHKVGRLFPNLEHFVNIESQLENLRSDDDEENDMTRMFANMKSLALTQTNIEGWENFEVLKHCPALVELKVLGIPFLEVIPCTHS